MMERKMTFDPEDEEFFGTVGSFGVPKFDNEMRGGVPRGFTMMAFTETGSGSELFAKQFTSPAEEPENTLYIATDEGQQEIIRISRSTTGRSISTSGRLEKSTTPTSWNGSCWRVAIVWKGFNWPIFNAWRKPDLLTIATRIT